jgi:hypothetical protein
MAMLREACLPDAEALVNRLKDLREPYRGNTIAWIESCAACKFTNLQADIRRFVDGLDPNLREEYLFNMSLLLDDAVRFFGADG